MSDQTTSDAPTTASSDVSADTSAKAEPTGATNFVATPGPFPQSGSFGQRGSGLARGKRPAAGGSTTAPTAPSGYKPSSLEVIVSKSEYKNPFTGETSVGAPVVNEPAPQAA